MKTSEALKTIYDEASKKLGQKKARQYLTVFFSNLIFDLETEGQLSAEMIERKINEEVTFISKSDSKEVA